MSIPHPRRTPEVPHPRVAGWFRATLRHRAGWTIPLVAALAVFLIPASITRAQSTAGLTSSYVADGQTVFLDPVPGTIAVRTRSIAATGRLATELENTSLSVPIRTEILPVDVIRITVPASEQRSMIERLRADSRIEWAEPVFRYGETEQIITGNVLVAFPRDTANAGITRAGAEDLLSGLGATLVRDHSPEYDFDLYEMALPTDRELDTLDAVRILAETPGVLYAEPVFYWQAAFHIPNDTLFGQQWAMRNTAGNPGTAGADIDATLAWDITRGDPSISIAILDEGVDVDHPDLAGNMLAGTDTTDRSPPGGVPGNADCGDAHGTACAGIAAGIADNSRGVSGVAPRCSIAPVRMAYGSAWTTNTWSANAFNWVRSTGHDVASCSWGVHSFPTRRSSDHRKSVV